MHAASHMELNMVLYSHCGHLFLSGLRLEFIGGGRLQYRLHLPNIQVVPGSQLS
jgi:hypothetical protein